jgi:transposase
MGTTKAFRKKSSRKHADPCEAANIHAAYHITKNYHEVARMMGRSVSTIYRIMKKYKENPNVHRRLGSGRPRKTNATTDRLIVRCMKRDRSISGDQIKRDLRLQHVSERLIRRRLSESGEFNSYWKTKTPFISAKNRKHRLRWCRERVDYMDAHLYNIILDNQMRPSATKLFRRREWIFQQDNDPKHTARATQEFFEDYNVDVLEWPAQSPDLNPIENLWSILDLKCKDRKPKNEEELFEIIQNAWNNLDVDLLNRLVESMPRRCQAVIDAKGWPTKY